MFMKTTEEYLNILRNSKAYLMQTYQITRLGIFGSVARKEQTETSDVDIYFESAPMGLFALSRLKSELENLLDCHVDLLRMRKQLDGTYLQRSIMKDLINV
jgi:predicted nucleotidyltransferase